MPDLGRRRITIIDDHAEFLSLLRELLSATYDVRTFSGRDISPDDIVESRPELLVVDLRLDTGDLQGWDVVQLVRAHRHLRTVPVIVCSADDRALVERSAAGLSAANVASLAKPFDVNDLEALIERGLSDGFVGDAPIPPGVATRSAVVSTAPPVGT